MQIMQNAEHFVISTRVSLAETNLTENKRFSSAKLFQLTSPQGDEQRFNFVLRDDLHISTHVSVRRRTSDRFPLFPLFGISTHVSVRRRTQW